MQGDYSRGVDLSNVHNLEVLKLGTLYSYDLTLGDATVRGGKTLHVLGGVLGSDDALTLDASAELDGRVDVQGGAETTTSLAAPATTRSPAATSTTRWSVAMGRTTSMATRARTR
jgi:hypothetical protein